MTPERLAQIELAARYRAGSYDEIRYGALQLLNEVARLRAGVRSAADNAAANEAPWDSLAARELRDLLNGGETM